MSMKHAVFLSLALVTLAGCADDDIVLPGTREAIRPGVAVTEPLPTDISLPAPERIAAWPMRSGSASGAMPHAALATAPQTVWTVNIGKGNGRRQRIGADPVAADGRIFTLDAQSTVSAVSEAGAVLWSVDLTPSIERSNEASGGGLGYADGVIYVTTGFGNLHALDAATGTQAWVQRLDAPIAAPTLSNGLAYIVSRDSRAWAIALDTGRIRWELPGAPATAVLATAPAPALTDRLVIFPFGSGELLGALRQSGIRVWGSTVAGNRRGVAYGRLTDIAADPVVVGDRLYAGTPAGRLVAMNAFSGARIWTATEGALSPVLPVADAVYFVSDRAELIRLEAETGAQVWAQPLPFFEARRLARRDTAFAHFGPILAGGQIWLASSDGALRAFDPESGAETRSIPLPGGAATRPIVMNDTLYVVSGRGVLHSLR